MPLSSECKVIFRNDSCGIWTWAVIYLLTQCLIVADLLRELLLILGFRLSSALGYLAERFSQVSQCRLEPPELWHSELEPTSHSFPGTSDPKGHAKSSEALIMILTLHSHNGPYCGASQMPHGSLSSRCRRSTCKHSWTMIALSWALSAQQV